MVDGGHDELADRLFGHGEVVACFPVEAVTLFSTSGAESADAGHGADGLDYVES